MVAKRRAAKCRLRVLECWEEYLNFYELCNRVPKKIPSFGKTQRNEVLVKRIFDFIALYLATKK